MSVVVGSNRGQGQVIKRMDEESLESRVDMGTSLKARRKRLGYPRRTFAEMTGVYEDHLDKVERGVVVLDHYHNIVVYLLETLDSLEGQKDGRCHLRLVA